MLGAIAVLAGSNTGASADKKTGSIRGQVSGLKLKPTETVVFVAGAKSKPRTHTISQQKGEFTPGWSLVSVGDTVTFPNDDTLTHNVFSVSSAKKWDFGLYKPGANKSVVFDRPGVIDIFCNIHPNMHAVITVVPSAAAGKVATDGWFRLPAVAAGEHTLVVWHRGKKVSSASVVVRAGQETHAALAVKP